jgi:hypothetical protein
VSTAQILLVLLQIGIIGVGVVIVLIGGWTIATGRLPSWVWLARMPADRFVRLYATAAVLFGSGAVIEMISWSAGPRLSGGVAIGFVLQLIALGIWFYIRSRAGFDES